MGFMSRHVVCRMGVALLSLFCFTQAGAAEKAPVLPKAKILAEVRIAAVGDIVAHGAVIKCARQANKLDAKGKSLNHGGFDVLWSALVPVLKDEDIVFANLETPIAPKSGGKSVPFFFNAPVGMLESLKALGVRVVSFANNHVYDQKRKGFIETLKHLDASGLAYVGAGNTCAEARRARILEVKGIKLAFLGASDLFNQRMNRGAKDPCAAEFDEKQVLEDAAAARKDGAELVILSLHWSREYVTAPSGKEVQLAHRLIEGGVDVLLGHHPHVLRPVEVHKASDGRVGIIAYSLGNFVSNQSRYYVHGLQPSKMGNTRDGVIFRFSVLRRDYGPAGKRVELANLSVQPLWTENNALARKKPKKASKKKKKSKKSK
ncbi:MAG: CapA family protein, partial [Deltaproteobacteria bacterium]|nr:CapA family protein [Deltaproteobacteria bacterium]